MRDEQAVPERDASRLDPSISEEAESQESRIFLKWACLFAPGRRIHSDRDSEIRYRVDYPNEDIFDVIMDTIHFYEPSLEGLCSCREVTEFGRDGKTCTLYACWSPMAVEPNHIVTDAMRQYFETDEAFQVFGHCVLFAMQDDIPIDFNLQHFEKLFYDF